MICMSVSSIPPHFPPAASHPCASNWPLIWYSSCRLRPYRSAQSRQLLSMLDRSPVTRSPRRLSSSLVSSVHYRARPDGRKTAITWRAACDSHVQSKACTKQSLEKKKSSLQPPHCHPPGRSTARSQDHPPRQCTRDPHPQHGKGNDAPAHYRNPQNCKRVTAPRPALALLLSHHSAPVQVRAVSPAPGRPG